MKNNKIAIILAFIAIYIIWGSTYLFNKILVQELPPFLLAGIRFVVAALIIFGIDLASGQRLIPKRHQIKNAGVAGFLFLTVGNGCAVWALKFIDSGFTALIISAQPMVLLIMLYFMERKPIYMKSLIGVVFGILGLYLLHPWKRICGFKKSMAWRWWCIHCSYILGLREYFCCESGYAG